MDKFLRKIKSKKGESFVEILISILIVALGCMLIASMYTSSMNLNMQASKQDDAFYQAVSQMEQMFDSSENDSSGKAVITEDAESGGVSFEVEVKIYGKETSAYKR